jgi:glutathione S-transferase
MNVKHLKLSHYPATRSARVLWALYETADCPIEVDVVNLYGGQQYMPEHMALNPNHNVPVLQIMWDDGTTQVMLESAAMIAFLADAFPDKALAPPPGMSRARADYLQMLHFGGSPMDMMLWQVRIHEHVLPDTERDARTIQRYRQKFESEVEPQLAVRLGAHDFICGDAFTAADCMIGHNVSWARLYGMCRSDVFQDYIGRLAKRKAFVKAFSDARLFDPKPPEAPPGARRSPFNG